jgi:hypothetical protein
MSIGTDYDLCALTVRASRDPDTCHPSPFISNMGLSNDASAHATFLSLLLIFLNNAFAPDGGQQAGKPCSWLSMCTQQLPEMTRLSASGVRKRWLMAGLATVEYADNQLRGV